MNFTSRSSRNIYALAVVAILMLGVIAAPHAAAGKRSATEPDTHGREDNRIPGRYIVVFEDDVSQPGKLAREQSKKQGGTLSFVYRHVFSGYAAKLSKQDVDVLRTDPRVKYIVPDRELRIAQTTPTGISRISADENEALEIDEADNLRVDADVAVLDTGIDYQHPDLDVVSRTDCILIGSEECIDHRGTDGHSHGTHVAGTIAAKDDGKGVVGVAPGARLWAVKVLSDGGGGFESWIIAGIDWVTAHAVQIEVANMSLGGAGSSPAMDEAITASVEAGVVYAVAAGNNAKDATGFHPANSPDVITVSALADYDGEAGGKANPTCGNGGPDDTLAIFSNYGEAVEIAAPGVCIYSTVPGGGYGTKSGTSMASPHVAGAAAILASKDNPEDKADVEAIRETLEEEGSAGWEDTSPDEIQEPLLDVGDDAVFQPVNQIAVTGKYDALSTTEAKLYGSVNPRGLATTYRFEYGTTTAYGTTVPIGGSSAGSGNAYVDVSQTITGLKGKTPYHYRVVATNASGTYFGTDRILGTTPPGATTQAASGVTANAAVLNATVNPEGFATQYAIEYGTTTAYGQVISGNLAAGTSSVPIAVPVDLLKAKQTYHFRVSATSSVGTTVGKDETFSTGEADWADQPIANAHEAEEEEEDVVGNGASLSSVSCGAVDDCMAVGHWSVNHGSLSSLTINRYLEARHWNGEEWEHTDLAIPPGVESEDLWVEGVSCPTETACFSLLRPYWSNGSEKNGYAEHWDGEKWTVQKLPVPSEYRVERVEGISCGSPDSCMALLVYTEGASEFRSLVLTWDGEEWSTVPTPEPPPPGTGQKYLRGVSCFAPEECMVIAAGWSTLWDGESWSPQAMEIPTNAQYIDTSGLSCVAAEACMAAGQWKVNGKEEFHRLAEVWDGEDWSIVEMPETPVDWLANGDEGLSCASAVDCVFVDWYEKGGRNGTVAKRWNGTAWTALDMIAPGGRNLESVACPAPGRCTAVGGAENEGDGRKTVAERLRAVPAVSTAAASALGFTQATLNGTVNPEGFATSYYFEYGPTTSYGTKIPVSPKEVGSDSSNVAVSQTPSGLASGTTYHFRLVAESQAGKEVGADKTFTTSAKAPKATTNNPTAVTTTAATLNGQVNPEGAPTSYYFEYGPTTSYGTKVPVSPKSAGSGTSNVVVSEPISGLTKGATYHYRLVAESAGGTATGADNGFATFDGDPGYGFDLEFGSSGSGNGQFKTPEGLAVDSAGYLFVADTENNRVQKFNKAGTYQSQFGSKGSGNGQFSSPAGMDFDASGNLYVVDKGNNRVQKFNSKGEYVSQFGSSGTGNGQFKEPRDIAVAPSGDIYVLDSGNARVQKFNSKGEYVSKFGSAGKGEGQFGSPPLSSPRPMGIEVYGGDVVVADTWNHRLEFFTGGTYIGEIGGLGGGSEQFYLPQQLETDSEGNLLVIDAFNKRVQVFRPGWSSAMIDLGGVPLAGIAAGPEGSLWVAEGTHLERWSPRPLRGPAIEPTGGFPKSLSVSGPVATLKWTSTTVTCSGAGSPKGAGEVVNPARIDVILTFSECKAGSFTYTSPGQPSGTVVTSTLRAEPVYLNAGKTEFGLLLKPPASGVFAEYTTAGGAAKYKVTGSVIAPISEIKLNESKVSFKTTIASGLQVEGAGPKYELQVSANGGAPGEFTLGNSSTFTASESLKFVK